MGFTYGADGRLIQNKPSKSGELAFEEFDIEKQIKSYEDIANNVSLHKEKFQDINQSQNNKIEKLSNYIKDYENHLKNQEIAYASFLNNQSERYSKFIRNQENICGSKVNQQNAILSQQQETLKKQQSAVNYFNILNEAQNHSNLKVAKYYKNLTETYPERFIMK